MDGPAEAPWLLVAEWWLLLPLLVSSPPTHFISLKREGPRHSLTAMLSIVKLYVAHSLLQKAVNWEGSPSHQITTELSLFPVNSLIFNLPFLQIIYILLNVYMEMWTYVNNVDNVCMCVCVCVPKSAQLLQFRYWGSVGFHFQWMILVQHLLYPGNRLERHRLTLKWERQGEKHSYYDAKRKNLFGKGFTWSQEWTCSRPTGLKRWLCALPCWKMTERVLSGSLTTFRIFRKKLWNDYGVKGGEKIKESVKKNKRNKFCWWIPATHPRTLQFRVLVAKREFPHSLKTQRMTQSQGTSCALKGRL